MPAWLTRRTGNLLGLLACIGLISYALFAQYGLHLEPCPLCILQRVAVITAGVLFLLAYLHNPGDRGARVYGVLIDLVALAGIAVAARQLPLHEVLAKVLSGSGECAKVDWTFLGLNMPTWVLMALVAVGTWGLAVNWFGRRSQ